MDIYRGITSCIPAAGDTILLWKDLWHHNELIMNSHQHLFTFAHNEDVSLADFHQDPRPEAHFALPLSMEARTELDNLMAVINSLQLNHMETDEWILCWGDTVYTPKKFYRFSFRNCQAPEYITTIWKTKCIQRHKVFAWLMFMDRINTRDMLLRRHFQIGDDHACMLCNTQALETYKHLFFECDFSTSCWALLGISWNLNLQMQEMVNHSCSTWLRPMFKELMILSAWNIWKQRNRYYFEGVPASRQDWLRALKSDLDILCFRIKPDLARFLQTFASSLSV